MGNISRKKRVKICTSEQILFTSITSDVVIFITPRSQNNAEDNRDTHK